MATTSPAQPSILIVDDVPENIKILFLILKGDYELHHATSGRQALSLLAKAKKPDLILLDLMMPEMDGFELCSTLKQDPETHDIPVIFITAKSDTESETRALAEGAVDFIHKPINTEVVRARVRLHLKLNQHAKGLFLANAEQTEWITTLQSRVHKQTSLIRGKIEASRLEHDRRQNSSDAIVFVLADLLRQRCQRLSKHSHTVASLAETMAKALDLPRAQVEEIRHAGLLHDIGLIGSPDRLLIYNVKSLGDADSVNYLAHPVRGQQISDSFEELKGIGRHIRHHHEAFDGSGFPDGFSGEEITLGGKIIHLAGFIENSFEQFAGRDAKYKVSRKVAAGMGVLFDPALSSAANLAIKEVLIEQSLPDESGEEIPVKDLRVGMKLGRNLHNNIGVLIVERGTLLTSANLDSIKRHRLVYAGH